MSGQFLLINMQSNDWINLTFISILVLLVLNKLLFPKRFVMLASDIFSKKYFAFYLKDSPLVSSTFNLIFFPINLLTISLTLFFISKEYYTNLLDNYNSIIYFYFIIGLLLFFFLKTFLRFLINIIISTTKKAKQFSFFKISIRSFSSLVLLPFLLVHQYSIIDKQVTLTILLSVFIGLLIIQYVYSVYLIIAQKQYSLLYIFLYLCTLEIVPTVIYIKLVFIVVANNSNSL
ncbi:MAG: DUF4271 domain-containing protein [Mycoplasmataceae bacterium]|nr:DUF4271 domain-containing protein [Mycoplasmataceae bacterium]